MCDLESTLKNLGLSTVLAVYREYGEEARREQLSYEDYLYGVLNTEYERRRDNRIERRLRESRLPLEKNLQNFDRTRLPVTVQAALTSLLDGSFLTRAENVLAFGNPGSGKTHLLAAVAQELIHQGHRILFCSCQFLVQDLLIAKRELGLSRLLKSLRRFEAIIIDDIGYVQ
jgi:DNA replication protein DnaC